MVRCLELVVVAVGGGLFFFEDVVGSAWDVVDVFGGGLFGVVLVVGSSVVVDEVVVSWGGGATVVEVSGSEVVVGSSEVRVGGSSVVVEESSPGTGRMLILLFDTSVVVASFCAFPKPTPNTATSRDTERRKRENVDKRGILAELMPECLCV